MNENKSAKTPADDGQPDAWCNGMPAYEGPLSKEQRKHLVQDLDAPATEWARIDKDMNVVHLDMELCAKGPHNAYTALAMAIWNKAIETEREACAELAMQGTNEPVQTKTLEILRKERERIAEAIRARGDK